MYPFNHDISPRSVSSSPRADQFPWGSQQAGLKPEPALNSPVQVAGLDSLYSRDVGGLRTEDLQVPASPRPPSEFGDDVITTSGSRRARNRACQRAFQDRQRKIRDREREIRDQEREVRDRERFKELKELKETVEPEKLHEEGPESQSIRQTLTQDAPVPQMGSYFIKDAEQRPAFEKPTSYPRLRNAGRALKEFNTSKVPTVQSPFHADYQNLENSESNDTVRESSASPSVSPAEYRGDQEELGSLDVHVVRTGRDVQTHQIEQTEPSPTEERTRAPHESPARGSAHERGSYLNWTSVSVATTPSQTPWSDRLRELCRTRGLKDPNWQEKSDRRGNRAAWSAVVSIERRSYAARFWYDKEHLDSAMEDAAEIAFEAVKQEVDGQDQNTPNRGSFQLLSSPGRDLMPSQSLERKGSQRRKPHKIPLATQFFEHKAPEHISTSSGAGITQIKKNIHNEEATESVLDGLSGSNDGQQANAEFSEQTMPLATESTEGSSDSDPERNRPTLSSYRTESDKLGGSRSYRSASVGTDIGNETDDTEWTDHTFDLSVDWRNIRKKFTPRAGNMPMRLEALAEESSDDGSNHHVDDDIPASIEEEEDNCKVEPTTYVATDQGVGLAGDISFDAPFGPHLFSERENLGEMDWRDIREELPEDWRWDVDYTATHNIDGKDHGCLTCTPMEPDDSSNFPLTISNLPVVLPVEYQWPPMTGVNPPPDPRPSAPIDCHAQLSIEVIRDLFLTFEGSIGFYLLINGLLQIIVPEDFDRVWASSHLPHKYGGLKVCYIQQDMEPTMFQVPSKTETMKSRASQASQSSSVSSIFRSSSSRTTNSLVPNLQLNDFIEARAKSSSKKEKFAGRIGLKVEKDGDPYLIMSTHVITEAILAKTHMGGLFGRKDRVEKLDDDWNEHVEIWAGNEKIGTFDQTFDKEAEIYPNGFKHDVTLIKPTNPATIKDVACPHPDLGWLSRSSWNSLRQRSASVKILGHTESHRASKTLKTSRLSEVLVVGEGIFLNQNAAKPTRDHDSSTWRDLVSRAVLYRVYPDFDPPTGYSGVALYAEGSREDGTEGPGIVGFQSFVQRSGVVQSFEMEGVTLEKRLKLGRVAFYGAFMVPERLKKEYHVV